MPDFAPRDTPSGTTSQTRVALVYTWAGSTPVEQGQTPRLAEVKRRREAFQRGERPPPTYQDVWNWVVQNYQGDPRRLPYER